jgi:biotin carboxylase
VTVASDEASAVEALNPEGFVTLDFRDVEAAARRAADLSRERPFAAVVGVDDDTAVAAAAIAGALGLKHNDLASARAARHKGRMRDLLAAADVPAPSHQVFSRRATDGGQASRTATYPCVLKPTFLAASRGVIRANDAAEFVAAWQRIGRILDEPEVARRGGPCADEILVEDYVPGREVALEGLLTGGELRVLAVFDKPDPLEGPFFEETIYVTPSRLREDVRAAVASAAANAARALGLSEGPVHAELRVSDGEVFVLELAARSIGGLCSRTLRFGTGMSLEELILRHAIGMPAEAAREVSAAGVMMIPIRMSGLLERVAGLEEARAVPGIVEAHITLRPGQRLVPLPEGSRYLGFLFSRAGTPEEAEHALRAAHAKLEVVTRED